MKFEESDIKGVWIIHPELHKDDRGRFLRAWCLQEFADHGIQFVPVQSNLGYSNLAGTTRGMHFQAGEAAEAKLVRCTKGAIFDVALDLRPGSPTFRRWYGIKLTAENGRMLYLPQGCAHGYQSLEDDTEMYYMTSHFYAPSGVRGARFDDPAFEIQWPLAPTVVSEQDRNWPLVNREEIQSQKSQ
jgi:dTDP-4-dehydrorhamnose 3,5-epimerase